MFGLDLVELVIESGRGGNGAISERRVRYISKGGPDGGEGGNGGSVYIVVDQNIFTFKHLIRNRSFKARNGENGKGQNKTGKKGQDIIVPVPPGTIIWDVTNPGEKQKIIDLSTTNSFKICVAKGGRGGRGNSKLANSRKQFPEYAQVGSKGEKKNILLELNIIADVAIIGFPNAGKSSLLAALTKANPEIAEYPFTTKHPEIGIYEELKDTIVFLDIPGLLKGASQGVGMGVEFLRHISRARCLVHIIDGTSTTPKRDIKDIQSEIRQYNPVILKKPQVFAVSKLDLLQKNTHPLFTENLWFFSSKTQEGLPELVALIKKCLLESKEEKNKNILPEIKPEEKTQERKPSIFRDAEGNYTVRCGQKLMSSVADKKTMSSVWQILEVEGVYAELKAAGIIAGDKVSIGSKFFIWGTK